MDTGESGGVENKDLVTDWTQEVTADWSTVTDTSLRRLILAFSRAEVTATTGSVSSAWVGGTGAGLAYTAFSSFSYRVWHSFARLRECIICRVSERRWAKAAFRVRTALNTRSSTPGVGWATRPQDVRSMKR